MDDMKKGKANVRPKLRPENIGGPGESTSGVLGDQGSASQMAEMMAKKKKQKMARQNSMVEAREGMPSPDDKNKKAKAMLQNMSVGMMGGGKVPGYKAGKTIRGYGKARGGKACKMR